MTDAPAGYPRHLEQQVHLRDGTAVTLRPIRPEDAEREQAFVHGLSDEARYFRFLDSLRDLTPRMLAHFTAIDYHDHLALIAVTHTEPPVQVAVCRYVVDAGGQTCEFAIVVTDAWQGRGLATLLMTALMAAARARGVRRMYGDVLRANHKMLALTARLGFVSCPHLDDPRIQRVERAL
ncbi:MAG: GNAT family N-acetyltransferase [Burkholderiales bacterium]